MTHFTLSPPPTLRRAALAILAAALALLLLTAPVAHAHAPFLGSEPAEGAQLTVAELPATLQVRFGHALRLTSVVIHDGQAPRRLSPPSAASDQHVLPMPELGPGEYRIEWRGLAADGHVMSGSVRFTITD